MRKVLMTAIVLLACSPVAFAADAVTAPKAVGNQGYLYKSPSKEACSCHKKNKPESPNLFRDIAHGIKKADNWVRENLW